MSEASSPVMTLCTPGSALAASVPIRRMRPCATVLRNTFTCSIPGSFTF